MFAVLSRPCFISDIEQAVKTSGNEIIYQVVDNDLDISAEIEKILRIGFRFLILDVSAFEDQNKIPTAIRKLRILNDSARIITIAPNMSPGNPVISQMVTMGVYDIINPKAEKDKDFNILSDLNDCLSKSPSYSRAVRWDVGSVIPEEEKKSSVSTNQKDVVTIVKGRIIGAVTVGVAGISSGIGCTHTAISVAYFLSKLKDNNKVAYLELDGKRNIYSLNVLCGQALKPNSFSENGIDFYGQSTSLSELIALNHYNYIVLDIGLLKFFNPDNTIGKNKYYDEFIRSSISLLICGSKPWYVNYLKTCLYKDTEYSNSSDSLSWKLLYNFSDDNDIKAISKRSDWPCFNIPYCTDLFSDSDAVHEFYTKVLHDIIPDKVFENKKKRRFFS